MPETAENGTTSGEGAARGGGGGSRGGRGGGRSRGGGGGAGRGGAASAGGGGGGRSGGDNNAGSSRRGGGGDHSGRPPAHHNHHHHPPRSEGGGGGGRSADPQHNNSNNSSSSNDRKQRVGDHKVDMRKYERMITATQSNFSDIKITDPITEDCLICCKPNDIFGVGPCRHPLCIECAIRIRVIASSEGCPVCRQPMETMAFVFASAEMTTISLTNMPAVHDDEKRYKLCFQNKEAAARYDQYLSHVCKLCVSDGERKQFASFVSLRQHMAQTHQLSFCHHCLANLQLFSRERTTYNRVQLLEHVRGGDRDDRSQKGHPKCLFCEERFFDEDDRYRHLRREHFFCQLCETTGAAANVFFGKHGELLKHYEQKHFLCEVDECKKAGIAFATKLDLDIHTSREHGKVNLAVDFSFNDRQVGGQSRGGPRGGRGPPGGGSYGPPPPVPQGPRGVGLVPATEQPKPRSDPSQFVVVPSAQASQPSLRYARQGGFSGVADSEAFPSLGGGRPQQAVASSSAGINYARGPPVVVPSEFPRLKTQPNRPPPPPAISAANIAAGVASRKKEKKKETKEEAFPTLGGTSRQQHQQQHEAPQWAKHTERFDVIDDDERDAFATVGGCNPRSGPPPRVGPAVQPSRVTMVARPVSQPQPRGKQPAPMPSSSDGDDFPSLPPPGPAPPRIDYGRVGGPLSQTSKWGKKASEQKKRPPPPPLPEPDMWPAMSSSASTAARPLDNPDWQEATIKLSKKALAKRENAEKNAKRKEEKRLAREAQEAAQKDEEDSDNDDEESDEDEEEDEEEEEEVEVVAKKEPERLIKKAPAPPPATVVRPATVPAAAAAVPKKEAPPPTKSINKGKEPAAKEVKKEEPKSNNNNNKTKDNKKEPAPSSTATTTTVKKIDRPRPPPPAATTTVPQTTTAAAASSLGMLGSLFNSVFSSFGGGGGAGGDAAAATKQQPAATTVSAAAAAQARGLSTAPPPGLSFAPPPGFTGPPPGFENAVKRS